MKIKYTLIWAVILFSMHYGCKKTDEDYANEEKFKGSWYEFRSGSLRTDTTFYYFGEENKGYTKQYDSKDEFSWEVRKKYLNTYYSKAPHYQIGYDKYNSKGRYIIESIQEDKMELTQMIYPEYHLSIILTRIKE